MWSNADPSWFPTGDNLRRENLPLLGRVYKTNWALVNFASDFPVK